MKRVKDLFDKIASLENLKLAAKMAAKGKKKRKTVQRFLANQDEKLQLLHNLLVTGEYKCLGYSKKIIEDRCSRKVREIFVPKFFPDQIVQWALILQIKPILTRGMYAYSCASIENRGTTYGFKYVKRVLADRKNSKYCLVMDIKKFYPSIDQDLLIKKFERVIKDQKTLNLMEKIVRSVPSGLPIGNYTSQWFANFFLQSFDHFVKENLHAKYYVRYMDDILIFDNNKCKLHQICVSCIKYLKTQTLQVKPNYSIFLVADSHVRGRAPDFLGYKFFRDFILMRGRTFLRARKRFKMVSGKTRITAKDASAVLSYIARITLTSGSEIYNRYVAGFINVGSCKKIISFHDKQIAKACVA